MKARKEASGAISPLTLSRLKGICMYQQVMDITAPGMNQKKRQIRKQAFTHIMSRGNMPVFSYGLLDLFTQRAVSSAAEEAVRSVFLVITWPCGRRVRTSFNESRFEPAVGVTTSGKLVIQFSGFRFKMSRVCTNKFSHITVEERSAL